MSVSNLHGSCATECNLPLAKDNDSTSHHPLTMHCAPAKDFDDGRLAQGSMKKIQELTFRVTGAASMARLEPLLLENQKWAKARLSWSRANIQPDKCAEGARETRPIDFVYETSVTKELREEHQKARVLNRLCGAQVRFKKENTLVTGCPTCDVGDEVMFVLLRLMAFHLFEHFTAILPNISRSLAAKVSRVTKNVERCKISTKMKEPCTESLLEGSL